MTPELKKKMDERAQELSHDVSLEWVGNSDNAEHLIKLGISVAVEEMEKINQGAREFFITKGTPDMIFDSAKEAADFMASNPYRTKIPVIHVREVIND